MCNYISENDRIIDRYEEFRVSSTDNKGNFFGYAIYIIETNDGFFYSGAQKCKKTIDGYEKYGASANSKKFTTYAEAKKHAIEERKLKEKRK